MKRIFITGILFISALLIFPDRVLAGSPEGDQNRPRPGQLYTGANLGWHAGTPGGTELALVFQGDYYLDRQFAVGPLLQFATGSNFFQVGISAQAKYIFENPRFRGLRPHLQGGVGFLYADVDKGTGDDDDLGFVVPFGGGVEMTLKKNVFIDSTILLNFTDAAVEGQNNIFMTWTFGVKFKM